MSALKWFKQTMENYAPRALLAPYMKRRYRQRDGTVQGTIAERFDRIYQTNNWGDSESRSGPGSNLKAAARVTAALPGLLKELNANTLLDIPCGDFYWMRHVKMNNCNYIGGDIVASIIAENQARYASATRSFICIDLINDNLPAADVLLVRDCFIHFSFEMINKALLNIRRAPIKYLLTTTFPYKGRNWDIDTGGFRPINLRKAPFNLPQPIQTIQEDGPEVSDLNYQRHLALWRVGEL